MKSKILDGILVQHDGIKCDAKILDTILRREMVISVKKKKTRIRYKLAIKKPLETSNIKANGFKMKGWKQICCCHCLDPQSCPTLLRPPWNHPVKITGVCCHALLQGISPTQGSNHVSASPASQADSLLLSRQICYGNINLKKTW